MRRANRPQAGCYKAAEQLGKNVSEVDRPLLWARRSLGEGGEDDDKEWRQRRAFLATRSEIAFHLYRRH
jgi:hypothetical protein